MECLRQTINSDQLSGVLKLPQSFRNTVVEVIVLPAQHAADSAPPQKSGSAFGCLKKYADPGLIGHEQDAWKRAVLVLMLVVMLTVTSHAQTAGGGGGSFTDTRDGKTYRTVRIGNLTWMAENLSHRTDESWCYDDDPSNCAEYGRLYTWQAAMGGASSSNTNPSGVQGVCPAGWHLPSNAEWDDLMTAVGGGSFVSHLEDIGSWENVGTKLKSKTGWNTEDDYIPGTDDFGFSALPGGYRHSGGYFFNVGSYGYWWSTTEGNAMGAWGQSMGYVSDYVVRSLRRKTHAFSVRCVRDY